MLEHQNVIDMAINEPDGSVTLVITDAGLTIDPDERFSKFLAKLQTYVHYAASEEFPRAHPGKTVQNAKVKVLCRIPATERMKQISHITPTNQTEPEIPVEITSFPGGAPTNVGKDKSGAASEDNRGPQTQLFCGLVQGDLHKVVEAIEGGANVNAPDPLGLIPLQYAVQLGRKDMVELLCQRGAQFLQANFGGRTLWITAASHGHKEVANLLRAKGVNVRVADRILASVLRLRNGLRGRRREVAPPRSNGND